MTRIFLSPPDVGNTERDLLLEAFDSNWIAPTGPNLKAFEEELASYINVRHAVAVSSGTAGLHLLLHSLGIGPGDKVLVPTMTFAATAFAVAYVRADPVFVDSELNTWNVDPDLVEKAIIETAADGHKPAALLAVDLYGRCADYQRLEQICERRGVILIEDAAEALGATTSVGGEVRAAGTFGAAAIFSFNGNKIITTSGGGMVVSDDGELIDRIRYLSTQARQLASHYEHIEIGFNYRLSNLLAALGRGQLLHIDEKVARRREINARYRHELADLPGIGFDPSTPTSNCWLTCIVIDPSLSGGVDRSAVEQHLESCDIESRPLWKPMHLQPVFAGAKYFGAGVSDRLFQTGLCLPSGSSLSHDEQGRVIAEVRSCWDPTA
ncbi:MAG: DegT/DnrJ/EryC1/StrS family aminotransferase [Actinomycetia bacterium]|nr:DegT/DnrJ/EryC1/StrS family aminotransferase [Actinomycetes bacterium]